MPTIGVNRDLLFHALGRTYTDDEFQELCFDYGLELDEVTSEKQMLSKEIGCEKTDGASEDVIYRIDIPANRYDLLCLEGLTRALLIFQQKKTIPAYRKIIPSSPIQLNVEASTKEIRPYVVAAILRDVTISQACYDSFIDLQDKLHQNICRKRTLASIGTHDLDTVQAPFTYTALPPSDIRFVPLNQKTEMTAPQLMEHYAVDSHLKPYLPIIRDLPLYPIVKDANGVILSLPPIINGDRSKITLNTKNIFIEVTATDLQKATVVLDTMVTMFSEYCKQPFTVEAVRVQNASTCVDYPLLAYRDELVQPAEVNSTLGINQSAMQIAQLLTRMGIESSVRADEMVIARIPPTRHDILHQCDIIEDVGISFGYNNIEQKFPKVVTVGKQLQINKLCDQLRFELARCQFTEVLTFSLCSREDISEKMLLPFEQQHAVEIANPKTIEFQVARTSLLPGLLKTLASNKNMPLPLRLFEISDVVLQCNDTETGARNERRLAALQYNKTAGFEILHGLLDRVMQMVEIPYAKDKKDQGYFIRPCDHPSFLPKRAAEIVVNGLSAGFIGVLHPQVILNFELALPCAALELNVQYL